LILDKIIQALLRSF